MRFLFALIALLSTICVNTETKPLALDKPGQIESVIFVNGKARKANYSVSKTKKALFSRERYSQKTARLIEVVSPNVLRVDNSGRQEEVQLLGLMDMSPKAHGKMRAEIQKQISHKLNNKSLKIYTPKSASKEEYNHSYIMVGKTLVNSELLREGLGVMTPNSSIDPLLLPQFKKLMNEAVKKQRGIWNPIHASKSNVVEVPGIEVKVHND
ncbi:MAG: thermonuclease family protein [bacterium]|nr:thermonuclease family protein [bacterium]